MRDLAILFIHLIVIFVRLLGPGGLRAIVAESLLLKHQLVVLNRSRDRAPNLRPIDRVIAGLCVGFMRPTRLIRSAIVLKPSTVLAFHRALVKRKYRLLFTPKRCAKPGPKGPFWSAHDLERKLHEFQNYYNGARVHRALDGTPPNAGSTARRKKNACLDHYRWESHCRGLYQLPAAA